MRGTPLIVSDQAYTKLRANLLSQLTDSTDPLIVPGNTFASENMTDKTQLPVGLERYSNFYRRFTVQATKITISPIWQTQALAVPVQYAIYPSNEGDIVSDVPREMAELPYSRYTLYRGVGQSNGQMLSNFMKTDKMFGNKPPFTRIEVDNSGEITGPTITPPSNIWNWNIAVRHVNGTVLTAEETADLFFQIRVNYYIRWNNRIDFPQA